MLAPQPIEYTTKDGQINTFVPTGKRDMTAADVKRLGQKAEAEGVKVFIDWELQEFIATSGTQEGQVYFVHPRSCSCKGFLFKGRCKHLAKLVQSLPTL